MKKIFKIMAMILFAISLFTFIGCTTEKENDIKVTKIDISGSQTANVGDEVTLTATITPSDATDKSLIWSSNDEEIATVSDGKVTCLAAGSVTITAANGDIKGEITITITEVVVINISISGDDTCEEGKTIQLSTTTNSLETVNWKSSDETVATVSQSGLVTTLKEGSVTITATVEGVSDTKTITVTKKEYTLSISGDSSVEIEKTLQLNAVTESSDTVTWSSSDETVLTIDSKGLITAVAIGEATVTATCGSLTATKVITVTEAKVYVAYIGDEGYETITEALVMAEVGATINVVEGTYTEALDIFQSVTLLGPNASINPNTGARVGEAVITGLVTIKAGTTDVKISGFEFTKTASVDAYSNETAIEGVEFSYNYVHDIDAVSYEWSASRNYDIPAFLKFGCQGNLLSNVVISNNKFDNVSNENIYIAVVTTCTISNNSFTNFDYDAIRFDGGYNYGVHKIANNTFANDTLSAYNGIYFRCVGSNGDAYNTELLHQVIVTKNTFKNIGQSGVEFSGAVSSNGYQEYGATLSYTYNVFENCTNYLYLRNSATAANHSAYTWSGTANYNTFIGVPETYYHKNATSSDTTESNPALINFDDNLYVDNDGNIILDKATIEAKLFGVKDFSSYLESYEALEATKFANIFCDLNFLNYNDGDTVNYLGVDVVVGQTAFYALSDALQACVDGDILYIAADTYTEEVTIDKAITIYGANYNVNPNTEERKDETIFSAIINVESDDVTINGITVTNSAKIVASTNGIKNLTVSCVIFDEDSTLNTGAVGQIELLTADTSVYFENITVMNTLFMKSETGTRITKVVATNVIDFTFTGNVCYGTSKGIYDDCLKFYTPSGQSTIGIQGNVYLADNSFYNIGQYTVWFSTYGAGKYEVYNNYFENVGLTDGASTYYRGAVTANSPKYTTGTAEFLVIGNEIYQSSLGIRLENAGVTAENWSATVKNNIFEEITHTSKIITNENKNELALINAEYNYFDIAVTADNFIGVSSFANVYTNREDVPKYIDPDKVLPTAITVSNAVDYIVIGEDYQIELTYAPEDTNYKNVVYSSSDEAIATVLRNGTVQGVAPGEVTITITSSADSSIKTTITLLVIQFEPEEDFDEILNGATIDINMVLLPKTDINQELTYTSSDTSVATVSVDGKITGIAAGTTTITVTSNYYNGLVYEFEVTIIGKTSAEVSADIDAILALLSNANVSTAIHNSATNVIGYQEPGYWTCDLYGSVSLFYFGDKTIDTSITTAIGSNRPGTLKPSIEYITVHDTASIAASATAAAHASYVKGGGGGTSWSYTVGADGIFFQIPDEEVTYHAGDGTRYFAVEDSGILATTTASEAVIALDANGYYTINGTSTTLRPYKIVDGVESIDETIYTTDLINDLGIYCEVGTNGNYYLGKTWYSSLYNRIGNYGGNRNSIGIETCVNQGADLYKTWQLTASLVAGLMIKHDLDISRVVQHHYFSGKDCPSTMRNNGLWDNFITMVQAEYNIQSQYSDYTITMVSNNPELVDNTGRVISTVTTDTTVTYTVTVSRAGISKSQTFTSVIPA